MRVHIDRKLGRVAGEGLALLLTLAMELSAAEPERPGGAVLPKPAEAPKHTIVRGRILLPDGTPAVGALVTVSGPVVVQTARGGSRIYSNVQSTACDNDGNFSYDFPEWIKTIAVRVKAPGTVTNMDYPLNPTIDNVVRLSAGTRVSGRVLHQAKGVSGVRVALVDTASSQRGQFTAVTGEEGDFSLDHVHPTHDHRLFVPMDSVADKNLAAVVQTFRSGSEGDVTKIAEINLHPACTVRGKVVMSKGDAPLGLSAILGRHLVSGDIQTAPIGDDGTFVFHGVPKESVNLWITEGGATSGDVWPSTKNYSLDPVQKDHLCGRVDEDLELTVLLDPITVPDRELRASEQRAIQLRAQGLAQAQQAQALALAQAQVQAQRVRIVNGQQIVGQQVVAQPIIRSQPYAPSDERTSRQRELQGEPLRGISETSKAAPTARAKP